MDSLKLSYQPRGLWLHQPPLLVKNKESYLHKHHFAQSGQQDKHKLHFAQFLQYLRRHKLHFAQFLQYLGSL